MRSTAPRGKPPRFAATVVVSSNDPATGTVKLYATFTRLRGTIASYAWQWGDGATSKAAQPSHTYKQAGTYTIQLTVTDSLGEAASTSLAVPVTIAPPPPPPPPPPPATPSIVLAPAALALTAQQRQTVQAAVANTTQPVSWSTSDASVQLHNQTARSVLVLPTKSGAFTLYAKTSDGAVASAAVTVQDVPPPPPPPVLGATFSENSQFISVAASSAKRTSGRRHRATS